MKLIFKERMMTLLDSYKVYNEDDYIVFTIKGQLSIGHHFKIYDCNNNHVATIKEKLIKILPRYEMYEGNTCLGSFTKEISLFKDKYTLDFNHWTIDGDILNMNYQIKKGKQTIATMQKKFLSFTDTYVVDIKNPEDALHVVMVIAAIDAQRCVEQKHHTLDHDD